VIKTPDDAVHRFWLPDLLHHHLVALRFLPQATYEEAAPLNVEPAPSSIVRVFMLWKGVLPEVGEQDGWKEAERRAVEMDVRDWRRVVGLKSLEVDTSGLSVLEWGGMEVK
jgi:hypothetical protein